MPDRNGYIGRAPSDSAVSVARQNYTSSGITTDFTFSSGYVPGYFDLYINGVKVIEGSDYTSSDGSTFSVLNGGTADGDALEAVAYKAFNAATVTNASDLTVSGNLTVNGSATFAGAGTSVSFATTAFNLSGTPDITIRNITGVAATFSGKVSYEDVVNIDSVGIVTAGGGLQLGRGPSVASIESAASTKTSTSEASVDTFTAATYRSAQYQIQVTRGSQYHVTTMNILHDGTNVFMSEFGTIKTGVTLATFDADINSGNVRLLATPSSSDSTVFKIVKSLTLT